VLCAVQRAGKSAYASALLVRRDSGIRDVAAVRGQRAVWVDPWSAAGYLVPRALLRARGIPPEDAFRSQGFVGSYDAVIAALRARTAEVGAAHCSLDADGTMVRRGWKTDDELEPLAISAPIPSDVLCASSTVDADLRSAAREILLTLDGTAPLLRLIGATHFVPADDRAYTALADALRDEH
jgi:ABC-type phosphate/phosphonate transport system substrate-binding protein